MRKAMPGLAARSERDGQVGKAVFMSVLICSFAPPQWLGECEFSVPPRGRLSVSVCVLVCLCLCPTCWAVPWLLTLAGPHWLLCLVWPMS